MISTLITVLVYGFIGICIADICLYVAVKIKEHKNKRNVVPDASDHVVSAASGNECSDTNERTKKGA